MNPDKHLNHQCGVNTKWALAPQKPMLHCGHKMFLLIETAFLSVVRITVGTMWLWPWDEFPWKEKASTRQFKLSLKSSRTSSFVSTCSDSELPSLGLFTLKGYWTPSRGAVTAVYTAVKTTVYSLFLSFFCHSVHVIVFFMFQSENSWWLLIYCRHSIMSPLHIWQQHAF